MTKEMMFEVWWCSEPADARGVAKRPLKISLED